MILYIDILKKTNLKLDQAQQEIMVQLEIFSQKLLKNNSLAQKILGVFGLAKKNTANIYLYGPFGTGKSFLVKAFFADLPLNKKLFSNFSNFMLILQQNLQNFNKNSSSDPLQSCAQQIAKQYQLICLDELVINNIADAMLVARFFKKINQLGVAIIFTSNFAPDDLYTSGLKRENFIPFIGFIKQNYQVLHINSNFDYRLACIKSIKIRFLTVKTKQESENFIQKNFKHYAGNDVFPIEAQLEFLGRTMIAKKTFKDLVIFSFSEICDAPLSLIDYQQICQKFNVILLKEIPKLSSNDHNQALRFINFIDALYENRKLLICTCYTDLDSIYLEGKWSFEFKRAVSRLHEMQAGNYESY